MMEADYDILGINTERITDIGRGYLSERYCLVE